jgi:hypothetical protein
MNSTLPPGFLSIMTKVEFEAVVSRNMMPAFATLLVFCMLVSRATICPSPERGW